MKKLIVLAFLAFVGIAFIACDSKKSFGSMKLKTDMDSVSYMIGKSYGVGNKKQYEEMLKTFPIPGNLDAFLAGYVNGLENADDTLFLGKNMKDASEYINGIFMVAVEKEKEVNKAEADKFLAENGAKSGVITTASGLQYKVLTEGKGPRPKEDDIVRIHYHGTLIDGTVFDSSMQKGEPIEHPVNGFITGWREGLQLMPVGSKYMFWIPIELGYYNQAGHPYNNKFLIFEVELLDIVKRP